MSSSLYTLRHHRKESLGETSFPPLHRTLDSLGNNLTAMVLLMKLSLNALQALREDNNLDQARRDLSNAVEAGNDAMKLMRTLLDAQAINPLDGRVFQA